MRTHGMTYTPTYVAWTDMLKRCYNRNGGDYDRYGGRGIRVCRRWRHNFLAFLADMGTRPSPAHSLDRRNTNKGYSRKNCRWATRQQQADNKPSTIKLTYRGRTKTLREWAAAARVPRATLWRRVKAGWSMQRALSKPASLQGEYHPGAKLTRTTVSRIRTSRLSSVVLARRYGVSARYVRSLRAGRNWGGV